MRRSALGGEWACGGGRKAVALAAATLLAGLVSPVAGAQGTGLRVPVFVPGTLNAIGTTGGLAVPDASSLGAGTLAFGLSSAREPQAGEAQKPRSALFGIGLWPGLDVVGRVAEYGERNATGFTVRTPQDLSVGFKLSLPLGLLGIGPSGLRVAAGVTDVAGGANWFRAVYALGTLPLGDFGPLREVTAIAGLGSNSGRVRVPGANGALDGVFGGVSARVFELPAVGAFTAHAEYDGRQPLVGARFVSVPLAALGNAAVNASLMQTGSRGPMPAALSWAVGISVPFGANERAVARFQPGAGAAEAADAAARGASAAAASSSASSAPGSASAGAAPAATVGASPSSSASPMAALGELKRRLVAIGLEAVRVGRAADDTWVVHYQNRRFGTNEVDALGVVTGVAARLAPPDVRTLVVVAHRQGLPVLSMRTEPEAWREYLVSAAPGPLEAVTRVQRAGTATSFQVDWLSDTPSPATRLQLQLSPELNYAVATEYGVFDYSLAGRVRATAPMPWKGGQLVATVQGQFADSVNARPGGAFPTLAHEQGLQALAVHQTLWLGRRAVLGAAVGRFEYGAFGAEGEALIFAPGRDDVIRLRGRLLDKTASMPRGFDQNASAIYRWVGSPSLWAELGWQRYTDGSTGPAMSLVRWWGDVGVSMNYRKGGNAQFAGVSVNFPLTPRAGMRMREDSFLHVEGKPSWRQGLRTRVGALENFVAPRAVRDLELAWDLDSQALNAGRLGPEYVMGQLGRMREAFFLYGGR